MNPGILFAVSLLLPPAQSGPPSSFGPMRNTFVVGAETVIDYASAVDVKAADTAFSGQFQQLKSAKDNLTSMAADDREQEVATAANDLLFQVSACHLQAKNGAPTAKCQGQITQAETRIMEIIRKHKSGAAWVDGPPA